MLKSRAAERSAPDESVEAVRRRARYRLVGALVLVALGVVGFPLVFDTQPRPMDSDLAIVIPDKNQVAPLTVTAPEGAASASHAAASTQSMSAVDGKTAATKADAPVVVKPEASAEAPLQTPSKTETKPEPKVEVKAEPKSEPKAEPKTEAKAEPVKAATRPSQSDEAARARAILEGKSSAVKAEGQWVVQVGAFSDEASITRVRRMLEASGLKTFTQAIAVKGGEVTRVRLGPYASTAEAERAQAKAAALGFTGSKVMKP